MPTIKLTTKVTAEDATIPTIKEIEQTIPVDEVRTPKYRVSHEAPGCKTIKRLSIPKDQLKVLALVPNEVKQVQDVKQGQEVKPGTATTEKAPATAKVMEHAGEGYCHKLSFSTSDAEGHCTGELPLDGARIFIDSALAALFGEGQTEIECITFYNRTEVDYDVTCVIGSDSSCPEPPAACKS